MAEKFRAALTRPHAAAKDFYDIWHLYFNANIPLRFDVIKRKMDAVGSRVDMKTFYAKLNEAGKNWDKFLFLLPRDERVPFEIVDKDIKKAVSVSIRSTIEDLVYNISRSRQHRVSVSQLVESKDPSLFLVRMVGEPLGSEAEKKLLKELSNYSMQLLDPAGEEFKLRLGAQIS
ncbi:nucleotidyl transferase AbiEii/AbiGii toxin family protein [archaeon]|nr:nucleotidyl transferase AbiEii/AbiGii toxin family protein [archaeon]